MLTKGRTDPLAALEQLRQRLRTRHPALLLSHRVQHVDWVRRFCAYLAERQSTPRPRIALQGLRDYLTHLAVRQHVSASTQNQALPAILFLCRDVLGLEIDGLSATARAKAGTRLPVVLSGTETAALLGAIRGTTWLMAALIYGGGLRVSECCELRVKDRRGRAGRARTPTIRATAFSPRMRHSPTRRCGPALRQGDTGCHGAHGQQDRRSGSRRAGGVPVAPGKTVPLRLARAEAAGAIGDVNVYFERELVRPRHIEVQILGDSHGTVVPFVERECPIERRHQMCSRRCRRWP